jgi:hypothetical protein
VVSAAQACSSGTVKPLGSCARFRSVAELPAQERRARSAGTEIADDEHPMVKASTAAGLMW